MKNICGVCLRPIEELYKTPCGHVFCDRCIYRKVNSYAKCPTCKAEVFVHQLKPLYQNDSEDTDNEPLHVGQEEKAVVLQLNKAKLAEIHLPDCTLSTTLDSTVTHVVLDAESAFFATNSKKYRMCVLYGLMIVKPEWLSDSIKAGKLLDTYGYNIIGDADHIESHAPLMSRTGRSQEEQNIFCGLQVFLIGDSKNEIRIYLEVSYADIGDYPDLIVCDLIIDLDAVQSRLPSKFIISCNWIRESICCYRLLEKQELILATPTTSQ